MNKILTKQNITNLLILGILILTIPIAVSILQTQQILKSRASSDDISFSGPNVTTGTNGQQIVVNNPIVNISVSSRYPAVNALSPSASPGSSPSTIRTPYSCNSNGVSGIYWCDLSGSTPACYSEKTGGVLNQCNTNPSSTTSEAPQSPGFSFIQTVSAQGTSCNLGHQIPAIPDSCASCLLSSLSQLTSHYNDLLGTNSCTDKQDLNHYCNGGVPGGDDICTNLKTTTCASQCGNSANSSPSPATSASAVPAVFALSFKIAEDTASLNSAPNQTYTTSPTTVTYQFKTTDVGFKNIIVQFNLSDGTNYTKQAQIYFAGADPKITTLDCSLDIASGNINFRVNGANFGSTTGTMAIEGTAIIPTNSWGNSLSATLSKPSLSTNQSKNFKVTVTRSDGRSIDDVCSLGVSQLSLGANFFCRQRNNVDIPNTELVIAENFPGGKVAKETVTIQKGGLIQAQTQLQAGKSYLIGVKPPLGLRRVVSAVAGNQTTVLNDFTIPFGNIINFPGEGGIDRIDTFDYSELKRQWGGSSPSSGALSADLNLDGKVNSFDFACLRFDYGKQDDPLPVPPATFAPSPSPSPSPAPSSQ